MKRATLKIAQNNQGNLTICKSRSLYTKVLLEILGF